MIMRNNKLEKDFSKVPNGLIRNSKLTINERMWMSIVYSHDNGYYLTHKQLARELGVTENTSKVIKKSLIKKGILKDEEGIIDDTHVSYTIPTVSAAIPTVSAAIPKGISSDTLNVSAAIPVEDKEEKLRKPLLEGKISDFNTNSFSTKIELPIKEEITYPTNSLEKENNSTVSAAIPSNIMELSNDEGIELMNKELKIKKESIKLKLLNELPSKNGYSKYKDQIEDIVEYGLERYKVIYNKYPNKFDILLEKYLDEYIKLKL